MPEKVDCKYVKKLQEELAAIQTEPLEERNARREENLCFLLNRLTFDHICVLAEEEKGKNGNM